MLFQHIVGQLQPRDLDRLARKKPDAAFGIGNVMARDGCNPCASETSCVEPRPHAVDPRVKSPTLNINRRRFGQGMLAFCSAAPYCCAFSREQTLSDFLTSTPYIDAAHQGIRDAVAVATGASKSPVECAVRIHDFVRDRVRFGWASDFYDQPASQVLRSGVGFCNTKSTLFVAMLRAAGIPARPHFVDIHASILTPFIDPGTAYLDHSFTEVLLQGHWLSVDSYIVDKPLFLAAQRKLAQTSDALGFGVHKDGVCEWNGKSHSFAQFVRTGRNPELSTTDHGVFDDVGAFYASGHGVNRLNFPLRLAFGFLARGANQRIEAVRSAA